jgi:hypothetical protein
MKDETGKIFVGKLFGYCVVLGHHIWGCGNLL